MPNDEFASNGGVASQAETRTTAPNTTSAGLVVRPIAPSTQTSTTTSVAASVVSVQLLAANTARKGFSVVNTSTTDTLYLKIGSAASTTDYTAPLLPLGYFEVPFGYVGSVFGVWGPAASGQANITEYF